MYTIKYWFFNEMVVELRPPPLSVSLTLSLSLPPTHSLALTPSHSLALSHSHSRPAQVLSTGSSAHCVLLEGRSAFSVSIEFAAGGQFSSLAFCLFVWCSRARARACECGRFALHGSGSGGCFWTDFCFGLAAPFDGLKSCSRPATY